MLIYLLSGVGIASQRGSRQPVFLSFASTEILRSWVALLRSHASGDAIAQAGSTYRFARSIEFELLQATLFGYNQASASSDREEYLEAPPSTSTRLFCEILVNSEYAGVTTTQKYFHRVVTWNQIFTFVDLPELTSLQVNVRREKKGEDPPLIGTASIVAQDWKQGIMHIGYIPICEQRADLDGHRVSLGEIKCKCKFEELIILPQKDYEGFDQVLNSSEVFKVLYDAEIAFRTTGLLEPMISICMAREMLESEVQKQAITEVDDPNTTSNALFRGTSVLSRIVVQAMKDYGQSWLESVIGKLITEICEGRVAIRGELNHPTRTIKGQEQEDKVLRNWCEQIMNAIYASREDCPRELRTIFYHIKTSVGNRFGTTHPNLHLQVVSAFVFLRFFVAAIIDPQLWGLVPGPPPSPVQHSLKLIGKLIQSLANLNQDVHKDNNRIEISRFIDDNSDSMRDFLNLICIPDSDFHAGSRLKRYHEAIPDSRLQIMHSILRQRSRRSDLEREAVGSLPYLTDVPQQLAILASLLAGHCQKFDLETFNKRGVPLTGSSLQRLAILTWQALTVRERAFHVIVQPQSSQHILL